MIDFIFRNAPLIALIFFFTVFCGVVITLLRANKKKYKDYAKIPLKEDDDNK
jgi:cbb3-type cytochrome oxidase subunit 3